MASLNWKGNKGGGERKTCETGSNNAAKARPEISGKVMRLVVVLNYLPNQDDF